MSIYDRIQEPSKNKKKCSNCKESYTWSVYGDHYPGNKMTEHIICPYCEEKDGSLRTSGFVYTSKIKE